jgi:hypothetical protein
VIARRNLLTRTRSLPVSRAAIPAGGTIASVARTTSTLILVTFAGVLVRSTEAAQLTSFPADLPLVFAASTFSSPATMPRGCARSRATSRARRSSVRSAP